MGDADLCERCGEPAKGYARINSRRYCHGDGDQPTCYMLASWEMSKANSMGWLLDG